MSESWNPYEVAPSSRAAAARAEPAHDVIAGLDVSDTWKRRFRLIEKAGGVAMNDFRDLPFGERMSISFNLLAFLFGPLYYLAKGLWRPALAYFVVAVAFIVLMDLAGLDRLARAAGYATSAVYALRANLNYYRRMVLREQAWL